MRSDLNFVPQYRTQTRNTVYVRDQFDLITNMKISDDIVREGECANKLSECCRSNITRNIPDQRLQPKETEETEETEWFRLLEGICVRLFCPLCLFAGLIGSRVSPWFLHIVADLSDAWGQHLP